MEAIKEFFANGIVVRNLGMLAAVLVLFALSYFLNDRYNKGKSKGYLYSARVAVVLAIILLIIWIF
ncbi:MAG: hypothetical protein II688_03675 [Lachnospiraceae bacterium]|jgi:hypothetical protein|nr:hypothetical protein [Lachnospiraceae bacterium]